jgi:hypothetical protein
MFLIKRKKIHVDCFTIDSGFAEHNAIKKAQYYVPSWWKKLNGSCPVKENNGVVIDRATMKTCSGFLDLYQQGLIIPMWADTVIYLTEEGYSYNSALSLVDLPIDTHNSYQYGDNFKNHIHIKIISPWLLKEKTGVNFLFTGCVWTTTRVIPKVAVLNGVINYKHQYSTHINTFFLLEGLPYQTKIEAGTPIAQIIPISEKLVEPHIHVVSETEYNKLNNYQRAFKFKNSYLTRLKSKVVP